MLTLMDRQLIVSYLKSYLICLISMVGLFIVVDLFTNLDNFTDGKEGFKQVMRNIGTWYGLKTMQIFDRLSEAIVLLAAMFTVALLQRNNELLPMLSAGVSTRRVVRPVLLSAFLMLGLTIVNQEFVLPRIDSYTVETKDFKGDKDTTVQGGYETNGTHISGRTAVKKDMTVYGFSAENWRRPAEEVGGLMKLIEEASRRELGDLVKNNVKVRVIGRRHELPESLQDAIAKMEQRTAHNTGIGFTLAINYGGRAEIVDAVKRLMMEGVEEENVTESALSRALYAPGLPDPDLMIRTAGEQRVSNFLIWQAAYAELYVTPVTWPEFGVDQLIEAVVQYQGRTRKFGGLV